MLTQMASLTDAEIEQQRRPGAFLGNPIAALIAVELWEHTRKRAELVEAVLQKLLATEEGTEFIEAVAEPSRTREDVVLDELHYLERLGLVEVASHEKASLTALGRDLVRRAGSMGDEA